MSFYPINIKNILILFLIFISPALGFANGFNVGAVGGYSSLDASGQFGTSKGTLGYGVRAGLNFMRNLDLAAEYTKTSVGEGSSFTIFDASLDYSLWLREPVRLFVGPKLGMGWLSTYGDKGSSPSYGGELGLDYSFSPSYSLGAELNYLHVSAPTINNLSGNSGSLVQALVTLKIWFY